MGQSERYKKRKKLWDENPHCYWCGILTILNPRGIELNPKKYPNLATIDHLFSKFNPYRWVPAKNNEKRLVLACYKCNNDRAKKEEATLPRKEIIIRSKQPKIFKKFLKKWMWIGKSKSFALTTYIKSLKLIS